MPSRRCGIGSLGIDDHARVEAQPIQAVGVPAGVCRGQAWARRWSGSKPERLDALRQTVLERLSQVQSPEQVSSRLRLGRGHGVLSAESMYRVIYGQIWRR